MPELTEEQKTLVRELIALKSELWLNSKQTTQVTEEYTEYMVYFETKVKTLEQKLGLNKRSPHNV